jgi:hypothetical protein
MKQLLNIVLTVGLSLTIITSFGDNRQTKTNSVSNNDTLNAPEKAVLKFYQWYLKDIYLKKGEEHPGVILTKDSIYKLVRTNHIDFLKNSGYFSDKFYDNEIPMFENCDEQLKKVKPKQVEESGSSPADIFEGKINVCDFMFYQVWTGGQGEDLSTVQIKNSKVTTDSATVIAVIGDSSGYKYSYPRVTVLKENGAWKISRIVISFKE